MICWWYVIGREYDLSRVITARNCQKGCAEARQPVNVTQIAHTAARGVKRAGITRSIWLWSKSSPQLRMCILHRQFNRIIPSLALVLKRFWPSFGTWREKPAWESRGSLAHMKQYSQYMWSLHMIHCSVHKSVEMHIVCVWNRIWHDVIARCKL